MTGPDRPSPATSARPVLAEPWNRLSVSGLTQGAATASPSRIFLVDCAARAEWEGDAPRRLSFGEFRRACDFFAGQLETLGLGPGDRAMLMLPNLAEAAIAIVGCLCAGVTPALAPIEEDPERLRIAAERIGAVAIIAQARCEDIRPAAIARQIAARVISVRCVAGFGQGLPEGVIPLEGWSEQDIEPNSNRPKPRQEREGLITFSFGEGGVVAHLRSEAQVIADAIAIATRHKLAREGVLVNTLHPAGSAAFVAAVLAPLFLGTEVRLVGPFKAGRLRQALVGTDRATLLCSARLLPILETSLPQEPVLAGLGGVLCVIRPSQGLPEPQCPLPLLPLLDCDEQALLAPERWPDDPQGLIGAHQHPVDSILPPATPYLRLTLGDDHTMKALGFCAAETLRREARSAAA